MTGSGAIRQRLLGRITLTLIPHKSFMGLFASALRPADACNLRKHHRNFIRSLRPNQSASARHPMRKQSSVAIESQPTRSACDYYDAATTLDSEGVFLAADQTLPGLGMQNWEWE
jgi:hypothetical protein